MSGSKALASVLRTLMAVTYTVAILSIGAITWLYLAKICEEMHVKLYNDPSLVELFHDMRDDR